MFRNFPELRTERFVLRQIRPSDAQAIYDVLSEEEVTRYYNLPTFFLVEQAEKLISNILARYEERESIRWGIARKEDDLLLGTCGFHNWEQHYFKIEAGYELGRPYWNQGVMTEALTAVLQFGFKQLDLNRVEALVMPGNVPSMKLLEKLGFQQEGTMRQYGFWKGEFHDLHMFAILQKDFQNTRRTA